LADGDDDEDEDEDEDEDGEDDEADVGGCAGVRCVLLVGCYLTVAFDRRTKTSFRRLTLAVRTS
jgi:hypothetical protein